MIDPDSPGGRLVDELVREDERLKKARETYLEAKTQWDIAAARYCAVRDVVTKQLDGSPYKDGQWFRTVQDGFGNEERVPVEFPTGGRYRFLNMTLGDALEQVLSESDGPMTLGDIAETISKGTTIYPVNYKELNGAITGKVGKTVVRLLTADDKPNKYRQKYEWERDDLVEVEEGKDDPMPF